MNVNVNFDGKMSCFSVRKCVDISSKNYCITNISKLFIFLFLLSSVNDIVTLYDYA